MRTFNATLLNKIANMPDIRPKLGGTGSIDLSAALLNPRNFAFTNEEGGFVAINTFGNRYECHTIFAPDRHFREVCALSEWALGYMFTETACEEIITKIPDGNTGAEILSRKFHFQRVGVQPHWNGDQSAVVKSLPLDTWARLCYRAREAGQAFHSQLNSYKGGVKSGLPDHPKDDDHDSMVGAAMLMAKAGNVAKGVNFYNRWATAFGYAPVILLSEHPVVVDVHDAIIGYTDGQMEVLLCR